MQEQPKGLNLFHYFLILCLSGALIGIGFGIERSQFNLLISLFMIGFGAYFLLVFRNWDRNSVNVLLILGIIIRLILVFSEPVLSDDYFRYIWDGHLPSIELSPYEKLPSEIIFDQELFEKLNSKHYYSVYPPTLQLSFHFSGSLSGGDHYMNAILLKVIILLSETLIIFLMPRLLVRYGFRRSGAILYALNPLVIAELFCGLHFESLMISLVILAFAVLEYSKSLVTTFVSGAIYGTAVLTKLWPLFFAPLLIRRINIPRLLLFGFGTIVIIFLLFLPFYEEGMFSNVKESLRLYFKYFEYNASFYTIFKLAYYDASDILLMVLRILMAGSMIYLIIGYDRKSRNIFETATLILAVYFFAASTVHPWYILPLFGFSVFTRWRFPLLWTFLIPFTYFTYITDAYIENCWIVLVEYVILYSFMFFEIVILKKQEINPPYNSIQKLKLRAAGAKWKWLKKHIPEKSKLLDVGSGNGALTLLSGERTSKTTGLDIKNKSVFKEVEPIVYDGKTFPFRDSEFDLATIITVLHHTPDPDLILKESTRVANRIIIIEDVYRNKLQKHLTFFTDSLVNMEFKGHPHTNRSEQEWEQTFSELGLKVEHKETRRYFLFFRQAYYVLSKS